MHEFALTKSLIEQVEAIADEHQATKVRSIQIRCGSLSGVEPELLREAFMMLRPQSSRIHDCELNMVVEPVQAKCLSCNTIFIPANFVFICPTCSSTDTVTLCGEDVMIESIELDTHSQQ